MAETIPVRPRRGTTPPPPVRAVVVPKAPGHLSKEAAKLWREIVNEWDLGPDGLAILRGALEHWDTYQACRAAVVRDGVTFQTESGLIRANPAAKLGNDAYSQFRMGMRQLGLEPLK